MKRLIGSSIIWVLTTWFSLFWISYGQADDVLRLVNRSEIRSLRAMSGRLNTQYLTTDHSVLRALALNRLNKVIIPVLEDDVIFHKISQKIRYKTATWIGKAETGNSRIILTLGDDHFFAKVVAVGKTILFKPAGVDNQAVSYLVDPSFEVPLINDDLTPPLESQDPIPAAQSPDDGSRIDVMVLYTDGIAGAHPGSQIDTHIQSLIDQALSLIHI